jgi:hypothetical protein
LETLPRAIKSGPEAVLEDGIRQHPAIRERQPAVGAHAVCGATEIGRQIIEEEQRRRRKAGYGDQLIDQLAADLTARFGKGFCRTNVFQMR